MVGGTRLATLSTPIFDLYDDEGILSWEAETINI